MTSREEPIRTAIAAEASDWFVSNDEAPLGAEKSTALVAWFRASPVHIEEFLGVASVTRDLQSFGNDPDYSIDALVARANADVDASVSSLPSRAAIAVEEARIPRWRWAAVALAALAAICVGWWVGVSKLTPPGGTGAQAAALRFETKHGEQRSFELADRSVLHLNTESVVTVRFSGSEREVTLVAGEAAFDVAHETARVFRVVAGAAEVTDVGTSFNVRLKSDATVITVLAGQVAVAPSSGAEGARHAVVLGANQQVSLAGGEWPVTPTTVDAQQSTAWLHRQIQFDHEPLERVAAEFNRYAPKPITITEPSLRSLEVSGVFSTDDAEEFLAFLRSLDGVRVEVTATEIRVSKK